jgi:hypothetical protein
MPLDGLWRPTTFRRQFCRLRPAETAPPFELTAPALYDLARYHVAYRRVYRGPYIPAALEIVGPNVETGRLVRVNAIVTEGVKS